jgi:hypothetical protein
MEGIKPDYVFQLNKTETKERMKKDYESLERLSRHLLWGHEQKDIVELLIEHMRER